MAMPPPIIRAITPLLDLNVRYLFFGGNTYCNFFRLLWWIIHKFRLYEFL